MERSSGIPLEQMIQINQIIADLYCEDYSIPMRIMNFFHKLLNVVYFDRGTVLFFYREPDGQYVKHSSISFNWDRERDFVRRYDERFCRIDDTLPVMDRPTYVIFNTSKFFDVEARKQTEYWKEYLEPNNCIYSIDGNILLGGDAGLLSGFSFYRGALRNDFTQADMEIIRLFQPHLSNVLKHYGEKSDSTSQIFKLENSKCVGMGIIDKYYRIARSDTNFMTILDSGSGWRVTEKILAKCHELKKNCIIGKTYEFKLDDSPLFVEITPFLDTPDTPEPSYYCLIYDLSHLFRLTLDQSMKRVGLTPRECEIIDAVLHGMTNEEISDKMFISLPTVKKALSSIYSKMDIKNQRQIFEKLMGI